MANKRKPKQKEEIIEINQEIPNDPTKVINVEINENELILDETPSHGEDKVNGLGDVVKKVTNALGFKTCDACEKRRQKLNAMFPFLKRVKRNLTEEEIEYVQTTKANKKVSDIQAFFKLYNDVFNDKRKPCQCTQLVKQMVEELLTQIDYQTDKE